MLTGFDLVRAAMSAPGVTSPERTVLLVLAVMANDEAQAWPPVAGETGLTTKCVLSERAVQRAVQRLVQLGHLSRRQLRHGVVYTIHPSTEALTPATQTGVSETGDCVTPDTGTPDSQSLTPATQAPKLPVTTISSDADASSVRVVAKRKPSATSWPCPDGVCAEHWADLLANRKSKRLPNTATAHKGILRELAKFTDEEWPPGRIVQHAAERGWGAIFDPRQSNGNRNGKRPYHDRPSAWGSGNLPLGAEAASLD